MGESYICIYVCPHCGSEHFTRKEHVEINFVGNSFTNLISEYPLGEEEIFYNCHGCKMDVKKDELKIGEKTLYKKGFDYDDWDFDDE